MKKIIGYTLVVVFYVLVIASLFTDGLKEGLIKLLIVLGGSIIMAGFIWLVAWLLYSEDFKKKKD